MPPARPQPVPEKKSFVVRAAIRATRALGALIPSRPAVAFALVGSSPVLVGVGLGTELGVGWGLVAGGVGAFGVGWLLGAE